MRKLFSKPRHKAGAFSIPNPGASMAAKNLKVLIGAFGKYPNGAIIPKAIANFDGKLEDNLKIGVFAWTSEPTNVTVDEAAPNIAPQNAVLFTQMKDAQNELSASANRVKALEDEAAKLRTSNDALSKECGDKTKEIARLNAIIQSQDNEIETLTKPPTPDVPPVAPPTVPPAA